MRVTQSMMQNNMMNNLFKSQAAMNKYLNQVQTGEKIERPSDDPVIAMKGMSYRTALREIEQYQRNADGIRSWMDNADDALDKGTQVMQRLEELAVQASTGTNSEDEHTAIKAEVEELEKQLIEVANTRVNGKYIFNGTDTNEKPVNKDGSLNIGTGRNQDVNIEISEDIQFTVNVKPDDVFPEEIFQNIEAFKSALDGDGDIDESLDKIQSSSKGLVEGRAKLGARMNRLELIADRLEQQGITAEDTMKKNVGVDFEEAITNLLSQEVAHRAALSAGAKIIQPSLIDFLR
ncbi:MAG TPA: flagellar hook-associated protein FlgL [Pseudogracilibacillus sp.]|nr:flagellar hook-associated protein FlgL [Pseudogracilibacillus sp.]